MKTLVIAAIDSKSHSNLNFLNSTFKKIALGNRNYVFSNLSENPVVIIYNFSNRRFFVDSFVYASDEQENAHNLISIIEKLNKGELRLSAGNWIEDLLESLGIKLNHTTVIALVIGSFAICLIFFIIILFYCGDKTEETDTQQNDKLENKENDQTSKLSEDKKNK